MPLSQFSSLPFEEVVLSRCLVRIRLANADGHTRGIGKRFKVVSPSLFYTLLAPEQELSRS